MFIVIWSLWFLSEIFLNRLLRSGKQGRENQDKGSLRIIWITIAAANTLGVLFAVYFPFPMSHSLTLPLNGLAIIVCGMIIRFASVWSLGRYFTVDVTIRNNHKLKTDGIYKRVRHPSYTGSILSFIGFGISLNNWISLGVVAILVIFTMLYRIRIEEQLLTKQFGKEYLDYKKKTNRLIPLFY
ncbi:MAG: isoprenylcysteine carboxylmethyltransferase family protein [Bacteroidales bacterium]|nr:isoprenylcysteine carboxylmethyltransferase family protein [Bacteroidales bacterium]